MSTSRNARLRCRASWRPRLEPLEDRRLLACIASDPFLCTPLPNGHNGLAVHFHPHLTIIINGQQQVIPANTNIMLNPNGEPTLLLPIHTHDDSGTLHVESPVVRTFFLKDFFDIWGRPFDQTHILNFHTTASNPVTMTVNGQPNNQYGNLVLADGQQIVITATNAQPPGPYFAVGGNGHVEVRRTADGVIIGDFMEFGPNYTGGISVAKGDINKDGPKELVMGTVTGIPLVNILDGSPIVNGTFNPDTTDVETPISFKAFDPKFKTGCNVAVGDVNGDGFADVIVGASAGNPEVRIFNGKDIANHTFDPNGSGLLGAFFAYGLNFNVGVNVSVGDINHDGFPDIITAATVGNPDVKVYSGKAIANKTFNFSNPDASRFLDFFPYALNFNVGAFVTVGDVNGDGFADLITGASVGNPHVKVYDGKAIAEGTFSQTNPDSKRLTEFFAYDLQFNIGVAVGAADFDGDGKADILTGASAGSPNYRAVKGTATGTKPPALNGIDGIPPDIKGGIWVAA
jgi:hypothetical protein